MADYVYIMANPSTKRVETQSGVWTPLHEGQVALLESDERHPYDKLAGERRVFCKAGGPPVLAFQTEEVTQKILEKQIVIVSKDKAEKMITDWKAAQEAKRAAATAEPLDEDIAEDELDALTPAKSSRKGKKADKTADDADDESETEE